MRPVQSAGGTSPSPAPYIRQRCAATRLWLHPLYMLHLELYFLSSTPHSQRVFHFIWASTTPTPAPFPHSPPLATMHSATITPQHAPP